MKKIFYLLIAIAAITTSCSKKNSTSGSDGPSKTGSTLDLIRDSVWLYAKEDYYWYDQLPTYAQFDNRV